jgi:hypothetical protein
MERTKTLYDISNWLASSYHRLDWNLGDPPPHLCHLVSKITNDLSGCVPWDIKSKEHRGCGDAKYNVKNGYLAHILSLPLHQQSMIWKSLWHNHWIPKINTFYWIMVHGNLLTLDNLQKRGIQGPSRCALCYFTKKLSNICVLIVARPRKFGSLFILELIILSENLTHGKIYNLIMNKGI